MALTRSSPEDRQRPALAGVLLPPAAMAACVVVADFTVTSAARAAVTWCGVAATALVAALAAQSARRGQQLYALRGRQAEYESDLGRRLAEQEAATIRLAEVVLPEAIRRLQLGESVDEVLDATQYDLGLAPATRAAHDAVLRSVLDAVRAEEDLRDSAQRAFVNIARRVQAIVHQQFQDLRAMEDRHGGDSGVFGDLLHLDHGTALIGRLADSIAVLGGSRPGRQWQQNVPLFSVLRGAMSRITDYQRVELHSVMEVAVVGPAVEPLIHALAELLDNATRYSPPHTRVHLTATEVQSGVAVEIEDGGVGLSEEARIRAERVLSHVSAGLDLADLGETPRLGLSVVGRLAQANSFQVSLRPSAYAGVRAVLIVPRELITTVPVPADAAPALNALTASGARPAANGVRPTAAASRPASPAHARKKTEADDEFELNAHGLPQRRRHNPAAPLGAGVGAGQANGSSHPPHTAPAPAAPAPLPGLWLAAFQNAVSGERPAPAPSGPTVDETSNTEGEQS